MNLKNIRELNKKSQIKVATDLNIKYTTYNSWEIGKSKPSIDELIKLANYFNVSIDYLVGREFGNDIGFITGKQHKIVCEFLSLDESSQDKVAGYIDSFKITEKR